MGVIRGSDSPNEPREPDDLGIDGYDSFIPIGQGGFGSVYRCRQVAFDRTVAVKVLATSGLGEDISRRFERECRAVGALSGHPYILTVHDSGVTRWGKPFIVMDYMARGSLADRVATTGPIDWQEAVDVGVKIAEAVAAANSSNILHRDIKPQNILISTYGEPKLADFGISTIPSGYQTHSGVITASIAHAPPEVLNGGRATRASDVYALASTIFTVIRGVPPFVVDGDEQIGTLITRTLTQPVPDLRSKAPDSVCHVLERAMEKDPDQRYSSALEFGDALRLAQASEGAAITPPMASGKVAGAPPASVDAALPASAKPTRLMAEETRIRARQSVLEPEAHSQKQRRRPSRMIISVAALVMMVGGTAAIAARGDAGAEPQEGKSSAPVVRPKLEPRQVTSVRTELKLHYIRKTRHLSGSLSAHRPKGSCDSDCKKQRSAVRACEENRKVSLWRADSREDKMVLQGSLKRVLAVRQLKPGRFYAAVLGTVVPKKQMTLVCKSSRSGPVTVPKRPTRPPVSTPTSQAPTDSVSETPTYTPPPEEPAKPCDAEKDPLCLLD